MVTLEDCGEPQSSGDPWGNHRVLEDHEGPWGTIEMIGKEDQGEP